MKNNPIEKIVLETISQLEQLSNRQIAEETGMALQQVRGAVARLKRKGLIEPVHQYPSNGLIFKRGVDAEQRWMVNE